ncbi:SpoIIE family protein phosphatase [Mitsuaria sp. GD03876]|uniref:SpoIIE family protein phosphatase n=1 Tax=Mitsuaria sp. GD03876 TaxID=2975399 RepID=UPI002447E9A5|nr:SpoIIE family protein phosphatase [Mitsuaria sp. GD03876]MDH0866112.1 SpoIIE family protein phosphatase [Mitsuaria sp. GD03876]
MRAHRRIPVDDASQVGEARRAALALAAELAFDEEAAGRLALAVTELGTNLFRHVGPGREAALLIGRDETGGEPGRDGDAVQVLSLDRGDGMDVERCLRDGYSTAGSSGTGLGAISRQASRFGAFSAPGRGTVIAARFAPRVERSHMPVRAPAFDVAGLSLAAPGESVSGDAWAWRRDGARGTLAMADGLGHGPDAAAAADKLMLLLGQAAPGALSSPAAFLERAHDPLRSTRGCAAAAVALAEDGTQLLFGGAGNIAGRLISGVADRSLMSQHGTLGLQVRRLQDAVYEWPPHAVLVLHSDGIVSRWSLEDTPGLLRADPAVIAGWIVRDHLRGRDDATVVVVRRHEGPGERG